ncbi:MAG: ATPase, T2SS/T4P/T4SS family [Nannocystaceae bacterium]
MHERAAAGPRATCSRWCSRSRASAGAAGLETLRDADCALRPWARALPPSTCSRTARASARCCGRSRSRWCRRTAGPAQGLHRAVHAVQGPGRRQAGPTGSGKSTTLAAMIDYINKNRTDHIITIEDPVEFVHENIRCLVNQREVGTHTKGFKQALRAGAARGPRRRARGRDA